MLEFGNSSFDIIKQIFAYVTVWERWHQQVCVCMQEWTAYLEAQIELLPTCMGYIFKASCVSFFPQKQPKQMNHSAASTIPLLDL